MTTPQELRASAHVMNGLPYSPGNRSWLLIDHLEALSIARQLEQAAEALDQAEKDAARYRWLRERKHLTLRSDGMVKWTRADGSTFTASHYLAADRTQYAPAETLDAAIDSAMGVVSRHGAQDAAGVGEGGDAPAA